MGLIKEPLGVDFYVDPKPLTKKEREAISKHIREYKEKMAKHKARNVYLKKMRRSSVSATDLTEITKVVEQVRAKRYAKK